MSTRQQRTQTPLRARELPTAPSARVRGMRHALAAVDNSLPLQLINQTAHV